MSRLRRTQKPVFRQTLKRKNNKTLRNLAIAFAIVVLSVFLYLQYLAPHTLEAKQRVQLESTQSQLLETQQQLLHTKTQNEKQFNEQQKKLQEVQQKLEETEKALQAKRSTPKAYAAEKPVFVPSGDKQTWLAASGIPADQWWAVDSIVTRESGWNPCAYNPRQSDCGYTGEMACGLAQALPCSKLRNVCALSDAVCHLKWQYEYVTKRYGGYPQAVAFWNANHWY